MGEHQKPSGTDGIGDFQAKCPLEMETVASVALVTLAVLLLLWYISRFTIVPRRHNLPPGPRGWPLIGALLYVGELPYRSFYNLSQKYGPIMYMRFGLVPILVVSNAEMAKEVLHTNDQIFASRPRMIVAGCLTYGFQDMAFAPYGPHWRQARKIANLNLFTPSKLVSFTGTLKEQILEGIHAALEHTQRGDKNGGTVNISAIFQGVAMNILTLLMWNRRHRNVWGSQSRRDKEFQELIKTAMVLAGSKNVADVLPSFLKSFAMKITGLEKRTNAVHQALDEFCESIICEKEEGLNKESKAAADEDDLLTVMLKLKHLPGKSQDLSRDSIKGILTDLMLGGTDSTSVTLDWTFTELMRHPDVMKKVQDELTAVVGKDRLVEESDIPNLKYLDAVVKETFRKHSAASFGIHHCTAEAKIGKYDIPANTTVFLNFFAIHHDPSTWESPWEYDPGRFLQSEVDYRGRHFQYLPFSSGRRICPGLNLASTFVHIALAQFLHSISWSLPQGQTPEDVDISEKSGLSLCRATPLFLNVEPRLAHHVIYPAKS